MTELIELAQIINGNKTKYLDIIKPGDYSKFSKLYALLLDNPHITDQEAFLAIYDDERDHSKFSHLKSRLEKRLINSLFIIDVNKSSLNETNVAYHEAYRHWAAVKDLFQRRAFKIGLKLAEKLFKQVIKFEIHEITVSICKELKQIYSSKVEYQKKYRFYAQQYDKYLNIYLDELKAENIWTGLNQIINSKTNSNYKELSVIIKAKLNELRHVNTNSFNFVKFYSIAYIYHYRLLGENEKIINICDEAIKYFEAKSYPADGTLTLFFNNKALALINSKQLTKAAAHINMLSLQVPTGTRNWHLTKILHFYVHLHLKDYKSAKIIYITSNSKSNIKNADSSVREFWNIYSAYLHFLFAREKVDPIQNDQFKFSINRFLNEVPQFSKDKQGLNVAIHIVHILFLLHQRKYNVIIDRMDGLQLYTYRHLRRDAATYRSNYFIKMLVQLPKGNFIKKRVVRYTDTYWQKLQEAPVKVHNQQTTLEIMPYEHLWELVLEMLD